MFNQNFRIIVSGILGLIRDIDHGQQGKTTNFGVVRSKVRTVVSLNAQDYSIDHGQQGKTTNFGVVRSKVKIVVSLSAQDYSIR